MEVPTNKDEKNNLLLISHVADPDGITPVILAKFTFEKFDTLLLMPKEVDEKLKENIDRYEEIHIVDLPVSEEMAKEIDEKEEWKTKVKLFDHHHGNRYLNNYSFAKVIVEENGRKESGTSVYYNYLTTISDNKYLHKNSTKGLVNQVRIIDTYDFKTEQDQKAHNIDALFSILGRQNYIDYYYNYIKEEDEFKYRQQDLFLIKLEQDKMNNYIEKREEEMLKTELDGYKVGIVYAERYRSDLGHHLAKKYPELDFVMIINISTSISLRGENKVDLSLYSKKYDGGGHKNAAGCPLPKDLLPNITKLIFKDIKIEEEEK